MMIESVAARQRASFEFDAHYTNLCSLQNTCPLPIVKSQLAKGILDINGDRIRASDWKPILETVAINKTLELVAFRSSFKQQIENHNSNKERRNSALKQKTPAIRSKEITISLCKALKQCLLITPSLTCIELDGLPLRPKDLATLGQGLSHNKTLKHLSLQFCCIGDEGLEIVCNGIKNSSSVASLNFSGCGLTEKSGDLLSKVIKHQAMQRHNEAWQGSLRYRRPDLDRMPGIRRITLNCNPLLGDEGSASLADALKDDLWLKALDLQECGVTNVGATAFREVLQYNTTLVIVDLRQNSTIDKEVIRSIMELVMVNCNQTDTDYKWMKIGSPGKKETTTAIMKTKKKRQRAVQSSSFVRRTTIKISSGNRNRARSGVGSFGESPATRNGRASFWSDEVRPGPGMPWRTAQRASLHRSCDRGNSRNSGGRLYENVMTSPPEKRHDATEISLDYTSVTTGEVSSTPSPRALGNAKQDMGGNARNSQIEFLQLQRQLQEEANARAKAEERVLELTVENSVIRRQLDAFARRRHLLEDEKVLQSIENSFKEFHAFLDLLKEAGLGRLITLAGINQSQLAIPSLLIGRRGEPAPGSSSLPQPPPPSKSHDQNSSADWKGKTTEDNDPRSGASSSASRDHDRKHQSDVTSGHSQQLPLRARNDSRDPTLSSQPTVMQGPSEILPSEDRNSKFDEVYQRALKGTERALGTDFSNAKYSTTIGGGGVMGGDENSRVGIGANGGSLDQVTGGDQAPNGYSGNSLREAVDDVRSSKGFVSSPRVGAVGGDEDEYEEDDDEFTDEYEEDDD